MAEDATENPRKKGSSAADIKLMRDRNERFDENHAILNDQDDYEMPEPRFSE